jgi:ArsR family transcriptional regulator
MHDMAKRTRPQGCCSIKGVPKLPKAGSLRLTAMLKALADPNRLEILRVVAAQPGPVCACDIVDRFDLAQPTISHHLKILCDAGLLISRKSGLWRFYSPDPEGLQRINELPSLITN